MTQDVTRTVAIIGTGGIATAHMNGLRGLGERVRVVAGVDVDAARAGAFCQQHGIPRVYTDVSAMLAAERPQLVHICTPPMTHCPLSIQCMDAGAWVLCEKPLCASLAELDQLMEAERRTGCYTSSVFQLRFGSGARYLKQLLTEDAMGRPLVALCNTTWYRDEAYFALPWRGKWSTELGGPTMGHGIHAMDLLLYLMGDWTEVRAMMGTLDRPIEVEDVSMAAVRFANGAMASIVNSVLSPRQESYLRLDFQRATVELKHLYHYKNADWTWTAAPGHEADLDRWRDIGEETPSSHGAQTAALLDSMDRGERPLVSGHEARRTIEFISSLYKAAATGRSVEAGSIAAGDPYYEHVAGVTVQEAVRA